MSYNQVATLTDFVAGTTIVSADVDANFAAIRTQVNGLITGSNTIAADTITEVTSAGGVTIDSVLLKDGGITTNVAGTAIACKDSSLSHGFTVYGATTFGYVAENYSAGDGGLQIHGFSDNSNTTGLVLGGGAAAANTAHTTSAVGAVIIKGGLSSAGDYAALGTNGNVLVVQSASVAKFVIDQEGDFFYDGADGGAFDSEDDVQLVRAFALATAPAAVIRTEFDDFVRYNEDDLVRLGILGDRVENGGLVNGAQLQRLLVGAVWQQAQQIEELRSEMRMLAP